MPEGKTFKDVMELCNTYLNTDSIALINKAYDCAYKMHDGQFRKSGDPYIQHPIEVAYILATLHTGPNTICAGFLHDVLEDCNMSFEEMESMFNKEIASIVEGVTKISKLKYKTKSKALAHNHEKLIIAMSSDVRVIVVKLADRLHNMRTIQYQPLEKQLSIAKETIDLYAPLAHRLGMYKIKAELEDLSFKTLEPETYNEIQQELLGRKSEKEDDIEKMRKEIVNLLNKNGVQDYEISGRIKNIYSIHNKILKKHKTMDDIFDLLALRVIVKTVGDCYFVLGLIHSIWTPLAKRFKDYIAVPKPNLYQSLHTTVVGPGGKVFEVQIRTYDMNDVAENGIAAHWAYKEGTNYSAEKEQLEITKKLKWYKDLATYVEESNDDPFENIKDDLFDASVFVFTPSGDVYDFPAGSMPLDFAYRIHSEVGNKCIGAIVNGKIVPLNYTLKNGDICEIKTSKQSTGPSDSWLKLCKTNHAKNKIKTYLNKLQYDDNVKIGFDYFDKVCRDNHYDIKNITDEVAKSNFDKYDVKSFEDLCLEIGKGTISAIAAYNKILGLTDIKLDDEYALKQYSEEKGENRTKKISKNGFGVIVDGLPKAAIKLGNCCQPVFGDHIIGFVSKGNGIIVHRAGCPNIVQNERTIRLSWDSSFQQKVFVSTLKIHAQDRRNLVADMINALNGCNVTIISVSSTKNSTDECVTKFKIQVNNTDALDKAMLAIKKMPEIYSVDRVFK